MSLSEAGQLAVPVHLGREKSSHMVVYETQISKNKKKWLYQPSLGLVWRPTILSTKPGVTCFMLLDPGWGPGLQVSVRERVSKYKRGTGMVLSLVVKEG